ncbi:hypothetical protein M422DRAFT_22751 [Sphaerobolus stellatus SS14]|nr:hypothetical protein M422DRAFT_22751 [Sphaerobolus stellatus SS14]
MLNYSRVSRALNSQIKSFSSSASRANMARLTLIGRLGKEPVVKVSSNDKEYVVYSVATNTYGPPGEDGTRPANTTWHSVLSFNQGANNFLKTLRKGSQVYVEAAYDLKEPDPSADPESPAAQRQIFLRHENIKVLSRPPAENEETESGY